MLLYNCSYRIERIEKKYFLSRAVRGAAAHLRERISRPLWLYPSTHSILTRDLHLSPLDRKAAYKEKKRCAATGCQRRATRSFRLKKKCGAGLQTRRVTLQQAREAGRDRAGPQPDQILREIDWFMQRYHPLPQVLLCYDRMAWFGSEDPGLRITFDTRIRWRDSALDLGLGDQGKLLLGRPGVLMEVKFPLAIPCWLGELLSELGIFSTSFSKYGTCYRQELQPSRRIPLCSTAS
jgi:hypothetical protein